MKFCEKTDKYDFDPSDDSYTITRTSSKNSSPITLELVNPDLTIDLPIEAFVRVGRGGQLIIYTSEWVKVTYSSPHLYHNGSTKDEIRYIIGPRHWRTFYQKKDLND